MGKTNFIFSHQLLFTFIRFFSSLIKFFISMHKIIYELCLVKESCLVSFDGYGFSKI